MIAAVLFYILLLTACNIRIGECWFAGNGRFSPSLDLTPPTITCPSNIHAVADPLLLNTSVTWKENNVITNDNMDSSVLRTRTGPGPGSSFSEGMTSITYHVRDKGGNFNWCSFNVTVEVVRCSKWAPVQNGWKACNVPNDMRLGTMCNFSCYEGHVLQGPRERICLQTGQWDDASVPYCEKIECEELKPKADQMDIVNITCTADNYFGSSCVYTCKEGYGLLLGANALKLCTENSTWLGDTPICYDTAAPVFVDCSEVVVRYASSGNTSGIISWPTPKVVDNSGAAVSVVQVLGPKPGALLTLGQYAVKYTASDPRNNTGICDIVLAVKQITCPALEQYPYTTVVCPQGRALGSVCYISCEGDTVLTGSSTVQCVRSVNDSSRGVWNVEPQPYCKVTDRCPTPEKPVHGQMQCEVWESGRFCQMTCDNGYVVTDDALTVYDEVQTHNTLLVCDEIDTWLYDGDLPHCQATEPKEEVTVSVSVDYTTVLDCVQLEQASEEVINSTIIALDTAFQYVCPSPNCTVISAQIFCIDSMGRSVMIEAKVDIDPESSPTELAGIQTDLYQTMQLAETLDALSIDVNGTTLAAVDFDMSQLIVTCKDGSAVDLRTLQCVQCNAGYYYDNTSKLCTPCPLGFYQNESRQYTCKSCPVGTSTPFRAATSNSQCLESCPVGHYSDSGTVPCSACGLGSFTDKNASIQCTPCPGAQITLTSGAQSAYQCQDFDMTFLDMANTSNSSGASVTVTLEMTFTLSFWVSCTECSDILTLKVNEDRLLALTNINNLTVHLKSGLHPTQVDISTNKPWNIISLVHTEHYLDMFVGDLLVVHQSLPEPVIQGTSSPVDITIGAGNFHGRFAQLHIWSRTDVPIYNDNYTCLMGLSGDLLNWRQFAEADGTFVVTATKCDEFDDCASSPCYNGAECKDTDNGYKCTCTPGYSGINCSVNINDCSGNVCHNGGTCVDSVAGYKCACTKNRTGNLCQTLIVNGGWTSWGTSGVCSVTCGQGIQQRTRVCESPTPKNGGTNCTGSTVDIVKCGNINNTCPSKCTDEPSLLDYGELNCQTIVSSKNETHVCHPACHQGYDFDNDIYVNTSGLTCGPDTGYTWNNYNDDNPFSQIPSCTAKTKAQKNTLYFSGTYNTLTSLDASLVTDVTNIVTAKIGQAGCVKTKSCKLQSTAVTLASNNGRKKRSLSNRVMFTATITCVPASLDNCYNLLQSLVDTLNLYITQNQFTVTWGGSQHNVTSSTTDGASECKQGYIPVLYYCVPCGKGAYADSNYCVLCARGTYQDLIGQTSCKQCPDGSTTAGLMTRDRDLCNIQVVPINTQVNWQIILVSCLGGVVCFALISYVLFVIYDRWIKEPLHKCLRRKPKVEEEVKEVPKTPPPVRFNVREKWFMGKPVRVEKNKVFDSDDTYSQQFETDITFDVVEDLRWKDHDFSSMELPRTPDSNRPWSPPIWNSSPKSMKHSQAWR